MDQQTSQSKVLTFRTNDGTQITLLWTHNAKTLISGKGSNTGRGRRKEKKEDEQQQAGWAQLQR